MNKEMALTIAWQLYVISNWAIQAALLRDSKQSQVRDADRHAIAEHA